MTRCHQLDTAGDRWLMVPKGQQGIAAQSSESDRRRIGFAQRRTKTDFALPVKHTFLPTQGQLVADLAVAMKADPGSVAADIGQHETSLTQMKPRVQTGNTRVADDEVRLGDSPEMNGHFLCVEHRACIGRCQLDLAKGRIEHTLRR